MRLPRLLLPASLLAVACVDVGETSPVCTMEARPAVSVRVQSAATDQFIAEGATILLEDGAFADSLVVPVGNGSLDDDWFSTEHTYERAGFYRLTVRRAGYQSFVQNGVSVGRDACHVQTVSVVARLQPAAP